MDLVIILHTDAGTGTLQEIAHFILYPHLMAKTAVLYPAKFYQPSKNLFSDTISQYLVPMPYSDCLFKACTLVSERRKWAYDMANGRWLTFMGCAFFGYAREEGLSPSDLADHSVSFLRAVGAVEDVSIHYSGHAATVAALRAQAPSLRPLVQAALEHPEPPGGMPRWI